MVPNKISNILGETAVAYTTHQSQMDLVTLSRKGVSKQALHNLAESFGITLTEVARLLPVTERTLHRRKADSLLSPSVSGQIILMAEVAEQADGVFGDDATFKKWLKEPNRGLAGQTPLSLLDTSIGIQLVKDELGRLAHGVYS